MKILACNSNRPLAEAIANYLNLALTSAVVRRFSDMEVFVEIHENVRGEDVFVVQSTSFPANDNLMELLVTLDALRRGSARRITAVVPYFGYARQDRKSGPRTPISAKLVANLITSARYDGQNMMIVSPDVGGVVRARHIARRLDADLAIIDKRRERAGVSEVMNIIGDVRDRHCILIDDIVDSAGTLCNAAEALIKAGAATATAYVTHGVLSGKAVERVTGSPLKTLITTDSIQATEAVKQAHNIRQLTIAPLMGESIQRISEERSVSSLFD
jgi:ribose-phosphate pyrophosphokinase